MGAYLTVMAIGAGICAVPTCGGGESDPGHGGAGAGLTGTVSPRVIMIDVNRKMG